MVNVVDIVCNASRELLDVAENMRTLTIDIKNHGLDKNIDRLFYLKEMLDEAYEDCNKAMSMVWEENNEN